MVTLSTRLGQLFISHVRTAIVLTVVLHGFPQSVPGKIHQIWPQPLPSAYFSFLIHCLIVLHIDLYAIQLRSSG